MIRLSAEDRVALILGREIMKVCMLETRVEQLSEKLNEFENEKKGAKKKEALKSASRRVKSTSSEKDEEL